MQAWDLQGRLFYMGNAFNRVAPQNGSVWVATYDQDAAHYVRTVIVGKAGPALNGRFNDKTSIEVDRGVNSPHQGNVYAAWSLFQGTTATTRSSSSAPPTTAPRSASPAKISTGSKNVQFADIAVTSNGTVYVAYRQFESGARAPGGLDPVRRLHRRWGDLQQAGHRRGVRALRRRRLRRRPRGGRGGARAGLRERRRPRVRGR